MQPLMFALGMGNLLEDGYAATGWLLVGLLQIAMLLLVIGPLQRWRPVEPVTDRARRPHRHPLHADPPPGPVPASRCSSRCSRCSTTLFGTCTCWASARLHLDNLWPGVTDRPWLSFVLYLVVFDFVDYWIHRGQHSLALVVEPAFAAPLAAADDDVERQPQPPARRPAARQPAGGAWRSVIGVAPGQFVAIVAITQLSESLQHANLRLSFGRIGERLWISPRFHRVHHSIGLGHESARPRHAGRAQLRRAAALVGHAVPHGELRAPLRPDRRPRPGRAGPRLRTRLLVAAVAGAQAPRRPRLSDSTRHPWACCFDSFWRAVAYCLHPRVIALSVLPLIIMVAVAARPGLLLLGRRRRLACSAGWSRRPLLSQRRRAGCRAWASAACATRDRPAARDRRSPRRCIVLGVAAGRRRADDAGPGQAGGRAALPALERSQGGSLLASIGWSLGVHAAGARRAGDLAAAVADPAAGAGAAAADLGLAHLPRDDLRCAGRPCERRRAPRAVAPPPRAAAGHRRRSAAISARRPACVWASGRAVRRRVRRCWCRWRSGSTRWCSRSPRSGSRTTAWPRCEQLRAEQCHPPAPGQP